MREMISRQLAMKVLDEAGPQLASIWDYHGGWIGSPVFLLMTSM